MQKLDKQKRSQCLDSAIVFANAHLMQTSDSLLTVMSCSSQGANFLYPDTKAPEMRQIDGQYEKFTSLECIVRQNVQKVLSDIASSKVRPKDGMKS